MAPPKSRAGAGAKNVVGRPRSRAERYAAGKALRARCPRESHAGWKAPANRRDAVELVLAAEKGRVPDLLPLRHGRMVRSAFTFYRGAALTMAADLAATATSGIRVQCCGDANLCNFGGFATPERKVIFSSGYMGKSDVLDEVIAKFSRAYAGQNEKDHALERALRIGKVKAVFEKAK